MKERLNAERGNGNGKTRAESTPVSPRSTDGIAHNQACKFKFKSRKLISCFCRIYTSHAALKADSWGSSGIYTESEVSQPKFEFTSLYITHKWAWARSHGWKMKMLMSWRDRYKMLCKVAKMCNRVFCFIVEHTQGSSRNSSFLQLWSLSTLTFRSGLNLRNQTHEK